VLCSTRNRATSRWPHFGRPIAGESACLRSGLPCRRGARRRRNRVTSRRGPAVPIERPKMQRSQPVFFFSGLPCSAPCSTRNRTVPEPQKRTTFRTAKCKRSVPNRAMSTYYCSPIQMSNASGVCPSFLWAATSAPCSKTIESCQVQIAPFGRQMQWWSRPVFALGCGVRAVLDEEPCRVWTGGPFEAAQSSGVRPSSLWAAASAPCSTRDCATSTCPSWDARCNGIDLLLKLREFTSSECSMAKTLTTSCRPQKAAQCKAVPQGSSGLPVGLPRPQEGTVGSHI